ncbi:MAG: GHKL domain-containing protein, partial [Candidatus Lokiarchaeota archaeon]|nr:GHKL domain-containing protein [Candidatus Lokiarchaeota archaeon]
SDLNKWNDIISEFRLIYLPYIIKNKNLLISSENVWHNSRILIGEAEKRILAFKNYMDGKRTVFFLNAIESFILAHEISNLMKTIIQEMPLLGIKSSYLSLYEKDNKSPSEWSRMILFFYDDKVCEVNTESQKHRFISKNLIPSDLILKNRRFEWVVEALRSKDEKQYGFIILEPKENAVVDYSNISFHISFALEEAFHFEEQKNLIRKLALSNEELEEFAYIVSHDLKNPLHTISGFLELLRQKYKSSLDEEALEIIDLCLKSGEKMKKLIVNLLDYSRLSTKMESLEEIDCNRIMKDVLFNLKSTIEKTKAIVTYDYLPTVIGDESQLTQLFQNLIDNAIKFHGIESPKVHVSIKQDSKKWIFSISDNGIGINPQNYELIFKIFKRLHTQEEYPGSGIGLAFCKKIVKRHRGKIWIKSKINEGSTFYFTIPKSVIS